MNYDFEEERIQASGYNEKKDIMINEVRLVFIILSSWINNQFILPKSFDEASTHCQANFKFIQSDAFITMPGGIGTLDELFDVWNKYVL